MQRQDSANANHDSPASSADDDFDPDSGCRFVKQTRSVSFTGLKNASKDRPVMQRPNTTPDLHHRGDKDDFDPSAGSTYTAFPATQAALPPIKHRSSCLFTMTEEVKSSSFHKVFAIKYKSHSLFHKVVQPGTPCMAELEAFCWGFYHFLTPDYVPRSTHAIYDEKSTSNYTGIHSSAVQGFKSNKEDPLQASDLDTSYLRDGITIDLMEQFDQAMQADPNFSSYDDKHPFTLHTGPQQQAIVTISDLKHFRIAKGHGCSLTASLIGEEDDLHGGNIAKDGKRIDFDMSWWPILSGFKKGSYINDTIRNAGINQFVIHADDIRDFPILKHASPYYWPTKSINTSNKLANFIGAPVIKIVSNNPWSSDENTIYKSLSTNPVFNYYKYKTLLKYILSHPDTYRHIAEMHIRQSLKDEAGKPLIDTITKHAAERLEQFTDVLMHMPEFTSFIEQHGASAFTLILAETETANQQYQTRIENNLKHLQALSTLDSAETMQLASKLNIPVRQHSQHSHQTIRDAVEKALQNKIAIYRKQLIDTRALTQQFNRIISEKNTASFPDAIQHAQANTTSPELDPIFSSRHSNR